MYGCYQSYDVKMGEIREKLVDIIGQVLGLDVSTLNESDDLTVLGINSLMYIKMVVEIEDAFDIEFEDEYLDPESVNTLTGLVDIVIKLKEQ